MALSWVSRRGWRRRSGAGHGPTGIHQRIPTTQAIPATQATQRFSGGAGSSITLFQKCSQPRSEPGASERSASPLRNCLQLAPIHQSQNRRGLSLINTRPTLAAKLAGSNQRGMAANLEVGREHALAFFDAYLHSHPFSQVLAATIGPLFPCLVVYPTHRLLVVVSV